MHNETANGKGSIARMAKISRVDFDDQFGFLHAELCHGRKLIAILNILDVSTAPGNLLSNA